MNCETIPSEILCEIFQLLCDKPISLHVLDNSSCFGEFPWAVGHVCKRWRAISLSYPHLWTSLSLLYHSTDTIGVDRLHEMSRRTLLYLERSKQLPLTITVCTMYGGPIECFPKTTWKLLLSCSERWERVDLALCHEPVLLDLSRCKMPIVKSLRLRARYIYGRCFDLYHPFVAAPCLVELDLDLLRWFGGWKFPWSQLTKISLSHGDFNGERLETILSQLQNVEELRVGKIDIQLGKDVRDKCSCPIRLPSLRLLAVPIDPLGILTRIEAPLLEHLWVNCSSERHFFNNFTEELSSFISRSSCHIRRLTLHSHIYKLLPRFMMLLSSVEEFCIEAMFAGSGSFLVAHITQINDGLCLPNLRELAVTCLRGQWEDDELMTAMSCLLERRSEESRLVSVSREDVPLKPTMVRMSMSLK